MHRTYWNCSSALSELLAGVCREADQFREGQELGPAPQGCSEEPSSTVRVSTSALTFWSKTGHLP